MKHKTVAQGFIDEINSTRIKLIEIFNKAIYDGLPSDTPFKKIIAENGFRSFIIKLVDKEHVSYFTQFYDMVLNQINHAAESALEPLRQCDSEAYWMNYTLPNDFMNQFKKNGMLASYFEYPENPGILNLYKPIIWKNHGLIDSIVTKLKDLSNILPIKEEILDNVENSDEEDSVSNFSHLSDNSNLNLPIIPPLVLNQSQPNQPIGNNQPMTELEKALAEIKALKEANAAKDLKIANMVSKEEVEQIIEANKEEIEKVTKENAEKDSVIVEQAQTINVQNKDLEHANQINELKTKENNELRSELKHTDYKLKTIIEHNKALSEQVKDHKELAQEWKIIVKEKSQSLQKTIEELTIEKAKVSELTQKIGMHNHDGSSLWIQLEQEEIPNLGEGALENQNSD